jgi:hypothetical protein
MLVNEYSHHKPIFFFNYMDQSPCRTEYTDAVAPTDNQLCREVPKDAGRDLSMDLLLEVSCAPIETGQRHLVCPPDSV